MRIAKEIYKKQTSLAKVHSDKQHFNVSTLHSSLDESISFSKNLEDSFNIASLMALKKQNDCPYINRSVLMVDSLNTKRCVSFICKEKDAEFEIENLSNFLNTYKNKFSEKKILQYLLLCSYSHYNNACGLHFKNFRFNENSFTAYAYCTDPSCNTYIFKGYFSGKVTVFASNNQLKHTTNYDKSAQCRALQRYALKGEIFHNTAVKFRTKKLNKQCESFEKVGRNDKVKSLSYYRNIKTEAYAKNDLHSDPFIDTYLMFKSSPRDFIQYLSTKLEVYLWDFSQIHLLQQNESFLLKKMKHTIRIDATGGIIRKLPFDTNRILLYSLVGHISEKKIVFSIADAVLSNHSITDIAQFLQHLKQYCKSKSLLWPICRRIVTDVSFAIIGAILKVFNGMDSVLEYLNYSYAFVNNPKKLNFVAIQFCVSHYCKIICKDIDNAVDKTNSLKVNNLRKFLRESMGIVFNLCTLKDCKEWFEKLCVILCSKNNTPKVKEAVESLSKLKDMTECSDFDFNFNSDELNELPTFEETSDTLASISEGSPFRVEFIKYFKNYTEATIKCNNIERNELYCPKMANLILNKYMAFLPMWSNIIGIHIDHSNTRVSNGPIESYFKNIKYNVFECKPQKLGRFIRGIQSFNNSIVKLIKNNYIQELTDPITPGTLIKSSRKHKKIQTSSDKIMGISKNRKLKKIPESWQKKNKARLRHGLFLQEHSVIRSQKDKNLSVKQNSIVSPILKEHSYSCATESCDVNTSEKNFMDCETYSKSLPISTKYYVLNLSTVFLRVFNERCHYFEYFYTKSDLCTLNNDEWLLNSILDACLAVIIFESKRENCLSVPCQTNFKNISFFKQFLSEQPHLLIIPHLRYRHFIVSFVNFEKGTLVCLDPYGESASKERMSNHYKALLLEMFPFIDWKMESINYKKQSTYDSNNCGVYVLQYCDAFINSLPLTALLSENLYRLNMKERLMNNCDPLDKYCIHCAKHFEEVFPKVECKICIRPLCDVCITSIYVKNNINLLNFICALCLECNNVS
ncbi:uncharacterized protein LOC119690046 [Teleopsis dalmanni]|uniref:uncharacterized protein LOC119690046 n=1 Tax=Teleopsis dalmanni TaxID=139649 RepID=UPI0018CE49B6|nr:uncharacterized protein LOC119690046 [Teleopsis dalmanni]